MAVTIIIPTINPGTEHTFKALKKQETTSEPALSPGILWPLLGKLRD
ncbi:hypothetical protein OAG11_07325 [Verrucomicrobia bacterium]|nr:hypothetical protein [Verrucomicrobiota bacterium]